MAQPLCIGFVAVLVAAQAVAAAGQSPAPAPAAAALTLAAAIREALDHSPDLQPHQDAVRMAAIGAEQAAADFGVKLTPTISVANDPLLGPTRNMDLSISKKLATGTQIVADLSSYQYGAAGLHSRDSGYTVGVTQPLLGGFQRTATAGLASAARATETARRERQSAQADLVVRVASQFFEVVKQGRLKAAAGEAATRAADMQQAAEARTRVGLATELDVLRAGILVGQTAAAVAAADGALASARDRLALTLGRDLGSTADSDLDVAPLPGELAPLPDSMEDLVAMGLGARIDVAEARSKISDAERSAAVAKWNTLPPLALDASYTQRGIGASNGGLNPLLGGWRFGLSSSYSLTRSAATATFETTSVAEAAAVANAHEVEQRVTAEVRQAYRSWQTASTTLSIQEQAVGLAQRELDLASLRYARGLASSLDVVSAESSLLQAESARIAAELDRRALALDLRRAVGQLDPDSFTR